MLNLRTLISSASIKLFKSSQNNIHRTHFSHFSHFSSRNLHYPQRFSAYRTPFRYYSSGHSPQDQDEKAPKSNKIMRFFRNLPANIAHEIRHYWTGTKLLGLNIKVSSELVFRLTKGEKLTRREKVLLERTVADMFRLVPFLIIVVVPFLEFTIPFLIKLFPGMLPSTFETKDQKKQKRKQEVKAKLEVAKFFQQLTEGIIESSKNDEASEQDFLSIVQKIKTGQPLYNPELIRFARVFKDEFTLESITQDQLKAMCRFFNIMVPFTCPNHYLVYQLERTLKNLKKDDQMLIDEGIETLTVEELVEANISRGMKIEGRSKANLQKQLSDWLDLSSEDLPPFLLLLSRPLSLYRSDQNSAGLSQVVQEAVKELTSEELEELAQTLPDKTELLLAKLQQTTQEIKNTERMKPLEEEEEPSFVIEADPNEELKELKKEVQLDDAEDDPTTSSLKKKVESLLEDIEEDIEEIKKK